VEGVQWPVVAFRLLNAPLAKRIFTTTSQRQIFASNALVVREIQT
jgi:hypothetical protein